MAMDVAAQYTQQKIQTSLTLGDVVLSLTTHRDKDAVITALSEVIGELPKFEQCSALLCIFEYISDDARKDFIEARGLPLLWSASTDFLTELIGELKHEIKARKERSASSAPARVDP